MFVFWSAVVAVGLSVRLLAIVNIDQQTRRSVLDEDPNDSEYPLVDERAKLSGPSSVWLRRYITTLAAFGYMCAQNIGWCTIPPRIQSITIAAFIVMNIAVCIHGYHVFPGNM